MPEKMRDLWSTCYDGEFRQETPEQFKKTFCQNCLNLECVNSRGAGTSWSRRMATQVERLLTNPKFADAQDPTFEAIRKMNFEERLEEALTKDVAERRGDWSIPTAREVGEAAAELVGMKTPAFYRKPEPKAVKDVEVVEEALAPEPKKREQKGQWKVRGDSQNLYQVTLWDDGSIECTCASRERPCKHSRYILEKIARLPPEEPTKAAPAKEVVPPTPPPIHPPSVAPPVLQIRSSNTTIPDQGLVIGGGSPDPSPRVQPPQADPWAPPPKPVGTIPVGGRVRFGPGKKGV